MVKSAIDIYKDCENTIKQSVYYRVQNFINNKMENYNHSFLDSISDGQYESKKWLCDSLNELNLCTIDNIKTITNDCGVEGWKFPLLIDIIGSWFGWPFIDMFENTVCNRISHIDLYDSDPNCHVITAQYKNHFNPSYKIVQHDDYFERKGVRRRHLVICTSCEHMGNFNRRYYKGNPFVCLQSNNYFDLPEHTNCVENVDELIKKNKLKKIWYKGEKDFGTYKRFMTIGQWQ